MPEASPNQPQFKRSLGLLDGIVLLVGITIGAGIYSTPQKIAGYFSSFELILAMWLLVGVFVFIGGLVYAELGARFPRTGGEYVYISRAFGPEAGFIFGWAQLFIIRTSPAAGLAIITVDYLGHFVPLSESQQTLASLLLIALLGTLNYVGIDRASRFQLISTVIKVGGIFFLVFAGLLLLDPDTVRFAETAAPSAGTSWFGRFGAAMLLIVFSYLGWDRVGYVAEEMRDPKRTVVRSMFWGISIVILVYVLANILYHGVLGIEGVRATKTVAAEVSVRLFGAWGAGLIAISVMFSASGSINGTMMTAPRVYYAMAHDGLFFKWFDYVHPLYRTPSRAILIHCLWAGVILLVRQNFENIVAGMTFAILIFYATTALALFKFRRQNLGEKEGFRIPWYPALPGFYLAGIVTLLIIRVTFDFEKSLIDLAFIATGLPFALYRFVKRSATS